MLDVPEPDPPRRHPALFAIVAGVVIAALAHQILTAGRLEHSALVFIGLPAIVALVVLLIPPPTSITGVILKAITLALTLSMTVLGEGFVCVLFASPLFYLVGVSIGAIADEWRVRRDGRVRVTMIVLAFVLPASLEGVVPGFEFARDAEVTRTQIVAAAPRDVEAALARTPRFAHSLPAFFELGFPTPGATSGEGLHVGATRRIAFVHGAHHPGALVLRVSSVTRISAASRTGRITFQPIEDDSYITHWLSWRDIDVEWREIAPGRTHVSWTLRYRRRLDPAWYFAPLERYAVGLAAGYLIDAVATPAAVHDAARAQ